jgi:predicted esterase
MEAIRKTPLFVYHGAEDDRLTLKDTEMTFSYLKNEVYSGEYKQNLSFTAEQSLGHAVSEKEFKKL